MLDLYFLVKNNERLDKHTMDSSVCLSRKKNIELSVPHVENKEICFCPCYRSIYQFRHTHQSLPFVVEIFLLLNNQDDITVAIRHKT